MPIERGGRWVGLGWAARPLASALDPLNKGLRRLGPAYGQFRQTPTEAAIPFKSKAFSSTNMKLTGVAYDSASAFMPGATVKLFRTVGDVFIAETISDSAGAYTFYPTVSGPFYIVAYRSYFPPLTWTEHATADDTMAWEFVMWAPAPGNQFVAMSPSGTNRVMTSPDGKVWTPRTPADDAGDWHYCAYSPSLNLYVAVKVSGANRAMTSSDAITWVSNANDGFGWAAICRSEELNLFVAVANGGVGNRVSTSPDGVTWTPRASADDTSSWSHVIWVPELSRFYATSTTGTQRVMYSTDGTTWTGQSTPPQTNFWRAIAYSASLGRLVAVADTGGRRVMTSDDGGDTWVGRVGAYFPNDSTTEELGQWQNLAYAPELGVFVAVAAGPTGQYRLMWSRDGFNWFGQYLPQDVSFPNGAFASDGVCWSPERGHFVLTFYTGPGGMKRAAVSAPVAIDIAGTTKNVLTVVRAE